MVSTAFDGVLDGLICTLSRRYQLFLRLFFLLLFNSGFGCGRWEGVLALRRLVCFGEIGVFELPVELLLELVDG